ncbi:dihydrofolate reductase family protein [Arthrobacter sp. 35W]|uniref:dihydrofolate reductase family protein n=1 Tax=Arthrobacter sp. 35W TaxID=1132441 RepID=UPI000411CBA7|nr:dihydrofolate reductase family protein [Arthrobacter sp. 35W]
MAKLIYTAITSLDGYVADAEGNFDWSMPDGQVHAFINGLERRCGTYLLGRRMYDVMAVWDDFHGRTDLPAEMQEYADIWHDADKIVYSTTLETVTAARTRLEKKFDAGAVAALKAASVGDISVGGPTLAAEAIRAGLVDEIIQFISPIVVGGGIPFLPDGVKLALELVDERRFDNGVVYLAYRCNP